MPGLLVAFETPAESCRRRGHIWHDTFGCADKTCVWEGKTYGGSDVFWIRVRTSSGFKIQMAYCNAFTGQVVIVGAADPDPSRADPTQPLPSFEVTP